MANFNDKINSHKEFFLSADGYNYFIERVGSMCQLEREFDYLLRVLNGTYRLFIQYKYTCRIQKMAGRCFMWAYTSNTIGRYDVRTLCLDRDGNEDLDNFGNPKFDYIAGAVLITDKSVFTYGDTWIDAVEIIGEHVVCKAYVCGLFVSEFSIPAEVFDRLFGLKENFPKQYTNSVQEETKNKCEQEVDLIEEAKRKIESCKNLIDTNECQLEQAMDAIKAALMDIEDQKCELGDMLYKLTQKEARREERR